MFLDAVQRLYDYQREVNNHLLSVTCWLSEDELISIVVEGQPSVRDTLFHMIEVIEIHFAWWNYSQDHHAPTVVERLPQQFVDLESLQFYWAEIDEKVASCIGSLRSDDQLDRPYIRAFPDGGQNERILWEMLLHVINHGTQHRSEVAMMLTKLGHSPGDMEIL